MVMPLMSPTQAEEHLSDVAQQFAQWRRSRSNPHGSRIPEPLWAEALTLAEVLPLTRVARQLGLKPCTLKRRRGDPAGPAVSVPPVAQLLAPQALGITFLWIALLDIQYADLPFPEIQRITDIEKFLLPAQLKIAQPLATEPPLVTIHLLTMDPDDEAQILLPTQHAQEHRVLPVSKVDFCIPRSCAPICWH
jgi:hypothetical protein